MIQAKPTEIANTEISAIEHEKFEIVLHAKPTYAVTVLKRGHVLAYGVGDLRLTTIGVEQIRHGSRDPNVNSTNPSDRVQEDFT